MLLTLVPELGPARLRVSTAMDPLNKVLWQEGRMRLANGQVVVIGLAIVVPFPMATYNIFN